MPFIIHPQYFGTIRYVAQLIKAAGPLYLPLYLRPAKMTYRNRTLVLGAQGVITLTVPLAGGRDALRSLEQITVDYTRRWQVEQWRTLQSCYNKSAFFYHYAPLLEPLFFEQPEYLWQYTLATTNWVLQQLGQPTLLQVIKQVPTDHLTATLPAQPAERVAERLLNPLPPYPQTFGTAFESNLSILDLLFNMGPAAKNYLHALDA
ncbi:MAG TPA: WbqC family protein [Phnomibacter sp.]|nr:WbqC family protein [Phnomibacter sp.]